MVALLKSASVGGNIGGRKGRYRPGESNLGNTEMKNRFPHLQGGEEDLFYT